MCYTLIGLAWPWWSVLTCQSLCYKEFGLCECESLWCKEIMEISRWHLGVVSFSNYLVIQMIYHYRVVFCLYNAMVLYNIPFGFKIFALLTCISITNKFCLRLQGDLLTYSVENYLIFHLDISIYNGVVGR